MSSSKYCQMISNFAEVFPLFSLFFPVSCYLHSERKLHMLIKKCQIVLFSSHVQNTNKIYLEYRKPDFVFYVCLFVC